MAEILLGAKAEVDLVMNVSIDVKFAFNDVRQQQFYVTVI